MIRRCGKLWDYFSKEAQCKVKNFGKEIFNKCLDKTLKALSVQEPSDKLTLCQNWKKKKVCCSKDTAKKRSKKSPMRRTHLQVLPGEALIHGTQKELSKCNTKKRYFKKWARDVKRGFIKEERGWQISTWKDAIGDVQTKGLVKYCYTQVLE